MAEFNLKMTESRYTLPAQLWPTRDALSAYGPDVRCELLADPKRPGLIGLNVLHPELTTGAPGRRVREFWFDPARDDLPVEMIEREYRSGADSRIDREERTVFSEFRKTKAGAWYPAVWKRTFTRPEPFTESTSQSRLQLWPGEKLPAEWFGDPVPRVKGASGEPPAK